MARYSALMSKAACIGEDPELFFNPSTYTEAQLICRRCPVIDACLRYNDSLDHYDGRDFGVWGGLPAKARIQTRRYRTVTLPTTGRAPAQAK
jgi:hypothetical protein